MKERAATQILILVGIAVSLLGVCAHQSISMHLDFLSVQTLVSTANLHLSWGVRPEEEVNHMNDAVNKWVPASPSLSQIYPASSRLALDLKGLVGKAVSSGLTEQE